MTAPAGTALQAITRALEDCRTSTSATQAEHVLAALQGLYVPPPPGDDRDALPGHLLAVIHLTPYYSTACQTGTALGHAAVPRPAMAAELCHWAARTHASCRATRKQDMAPCICGCHRAAAT